MNEFLSQLKRLSPITAPQGSKLMTGKEIFFMLKKGENDTFIIPVDKRMNRVEADYHFYSGDV